MEKLFTSNVIAISQIFTVSLTSQVDIFLSTMTKNDLLLRKFCHTIVYLPSRSLEGHFFLLNNVMGKAIKMLRWFVRTKIYHIYNETILYCFANVSWVPVFQQQLDTITRVALQHSKEKGQDVNSSFATFLPIQK